MERPAFEVIEVFDDQSVKRIFSFGDGEFLPQCDSALRQYAFSIHKDAARGRFDVIIWSEFLCKTLGLPAGCVINLPYLSQHYASLRQKWLSLEASPLITASIEEINCLKLLTEHFLLDRKLFSGFDLEHLYNQGDLSKDHWQDMQHTSTLHDLRRIDDSFQKYFQSRAEVIDEGDGNIDDTDGIFQGNDTQNGIFRFDEKEECTDASNTTQPADYQILRKIRSLYFNYTCVRDYSHDEGPMDFEKSYIWELHKSRLCTPSDKITLDYISEPLLDPDDSITREILSLIFGSTSMDLSSLNGHRIIFYCQNHTPLPSSVIRPLYEEEKVEFITARLHSVFKREDSKLRYELRQIEQEEQAISSQRALHTRIKSCNFVHQRYHKAWNTGIAAIRRILRGILPPSLEQIIRILQVAYAMGLQDPNNPDFRASFTGDLGRWRTIIPEDDLSLFDAIVKRLWGQKFNVQSNVSLGYGANENLLYLQQLLSGLISGNPLAEIPAETREGDQSGGDGQHAEVVFNSILDVPTNLPNSIEDPMAYPDTRKPPIYWKPAEPVIILMMAGAIFGSIFSFLLLLRSASPLLYSQLHSLRNFSFATFEERNLHILLIYLGLSSSSIWQEANDTKIGTPPSYIPQDVQQQAMGLMEATLDITMRGELPHIHSATQSPIAEPPTASSPPTIQAPSVDGLRCRRCNKRFSSVGNCNRHVRYDCGRRAQYPCRNHGCNTITTRKAYRDKHEKFYCSQK